MVTNDDLKEWMETSDEWIQERTGIKERRWIDPTTGETTSTMAMVEVVSPVVGSIHLLSLIPVLS